MVACCCLGRGRGEGDRQRLAVSRWLGQEDWLCWCGRGVRFYVGWCQFCSNTLWQLIKKVFSLLNIIWTTLVLHAFFFARITGRTNFLDCCCCCFAAIPFSLGLLLHGLATRHPCKLANSAHTFEIQTGSGWGPVVITGVGSRQQWMNFHLLPSPLSTVNPLIVIVCIYVKDAPKTDIWGLLQICNAFPAESSPSSIWCRFLSVFSAVEQSLVEVALYFREDTIYMERKHGN